MNRTRQTRNRVISADGISERHYTAFTAGDFFEAEGYTIGKSEDELRAFWLANQEAIMQRFMADSQRRNRPAQRPWAWWKWSVQEPQRPTAPGQFDSQRVWDHRRSVFDWVEDDYSYLKRLDLLQDWEMAA